MFCKFCGKELKDDADICLNCGKITDNFIENFACDCEDEVVPNHFCGEPEHGHEHHCCNQPDCGCKEHGHKHGNPVVAAESKIYGILGFILSFFNPIVGLILSIISVCKYSNSECKKGKGLAIAGIVISAIFILALIIALLAYYNTSHISYVYDAGYSG